MEKELGRFIKQQRVKVDKNQKEIAEYVGVTSGVVSNWESNRTKPDFDCINKLCEILQITPDELCKQKLNEEGNLGIDLEQPEQKNEEVMIKEEQKKKDKIYKCLFILLSILIIFFFFKVNHKETEIYEIRSASNDVVVEGNIMVKENELYINLNSVMLNNVYNDEKTFCSDFTLYNNDKLVISINDINTCVVFDGDEPKELSEMVYNDVRIFHQITALDKKDMNFKLELNYIDGNETKKDYHYSDKIRKIIKEIYKGAYKRNKCDILDKCI